MARFRVIRRIPAVYSEVYETDASTPEEAERALVGGRARCKLRSFTTTPRTSQPAGFPTLVLAEGEPARAGSFVYPDVEIVRSQEFMNAVFPDTPGGDLQRVVQELDE